jgi:hypothetical protein
MNRTIPPVSNFFYQTCGRAWRQLSAKVTIIFLLGPLLQTVSAAPESSEPHAESNIDFYERGRWELSLESTYTFHRTSSPFHSLIAGRMLSPNPIHYHLATQLLALRYRLTNASGPWFLRGSLESSATVVATTIVRGPENYFAGFALGLRYDFVQPGARLVPFIEMRGGPGATDSRGGYDQQQQDLVFTYLLSGGVRYDFSSRWSVTVGAMDQHFSNAYLAPRNYGFDSLGVTLGVFTRF